MRGSSLVVSLLLCGVSSTAWAVDGVGLFQFFPVLEWVVWLALACVAAVVFRRGAFPRSGPPSLIRRVAATAVAGLLISPMLFAFSLPLYARSLCSRASLEIETEPVAWAPSAPGTIASFSSRINGRGEVETNSIPGLVEQYGRESEGLGVWRFTYRLVDQSTGKPLISATYFGTRRGGAACGEVAFQYWELRNQFVKKASAAAR